MTTRQNILRELRRQRYERVGFDFDLSPGLLSEFQRRMGREDYKDFYGVPVRMVELNATRLTTDYTGFYPKLPAGTTPLHWNPEWGVMGAPGPTAHFQEMLHPMAAFTSPEQVQAYPWPDFLADYRWVGAMEKVEAIKARDLVCGAFMEMTLFEMAWYRQRETPPCRQRVRLEFPRRIW